MDPQDLTDVFAIAAEERRICREEEVKPLLEALKLAWQWLGIRGSDRPAKVDKAILDAIAKAEEKG